MAGWNSDIFLNDRDHAHATHYRWVKRCLSPQYRLLAELCGRVNDRRDEILKERGQESVASGGPEWHAATRAAEAELGEVPDQMFPVLNPKWRDYSPTQCGGCSYYVSLEGALGFDWGACTNPESPHDGTLMFEHDGCAWFSMISSKAEEARQE